MTDAIMERPRENIFSKFFETPAYIENSMRSVKNFTVKKQWTLKAPISLIKGIDKDNSEEISLVIHHETEDGDNDLTETLHIVEMVRELDHVNILKFFDTIKGEKLTDVAFLFEAHSDILSQIMAENVEDLYQPPKIKTIMRHLFAALHYLHRNKIIHMNIQPENLLLSSKGQLKVWNFQNALKMGHKPKRLIVNEFRYQPVEVLLESGQYNETVDIWSANCIFAQLWLRKSLFPGHGREMVLRAMFRLLGFPRKQIWEEFSSFLGADKVSFCFKHLCYNMLDSYFRKNCDSDISQNAMDLMHKCFYYNPKYRLKAEHCLVHPYFSENPTGCPVENIVSMMENASINREIRKAKEAKIV